MINATNIHKSYGSLNVLKGVDLQIPAGEIVSIVGPSGSGKSTLLHILGTLDKPDKGELSIDGEKISFNSDKQVAAFRNQHIGFVFQAYHLIDELTVYENIETPLIYQDIKGSERKAMVADMLDRFSVVVGARTTSSPSDIAS